MDKKQSKPEPFGFILVTSDPDLLSGTRGTAYLLAKARLDSGLWPIYARTANRARLVPGAPLAFYIAGTKRNSGMIVATARVRDRREGHQIRGPVDPEKYMTDQPATVLELEDVRYLKTPLEFRTKLKLLSFRPKNLTKWGTILMGGCRAVSEPDWNVLFNAAQYRA